MADSSFIDVTTTLTALIINGISSHSSLLDSYVVLHAAFISSLHKVVGIEFGTSLFPSLSNSLLTPVKLLISFSRSCRPMKTTIGKCQRKRRLQHPGTMMAKNALTSSF